MTEPRAVTEDRRGEDGAVAEATDRGSVPYFDTIAENYASVYTEDSLWGHVMRERKTRLLELLAGVEGKVLDIGCGPGIMVADILDLGCRFWGVDGSPRMIDQCLKQFGDSPDARFDVMNAEALRFPDDSFDAVTCVGVIDRVTRPEQAIAEMARVLKPNGRLLISFPNLVSPYAFWRVYIYYPAVGLLKSAISRTTGHTWRTDLCSATGRLWAPGAARCTVERLAGPVQATAYYDFGLIPAPLETTLLRTTAKRVAQRLECCRNGPLRWIGAGFIIRAEKRR